MKITFKEKEKLESLFYEWANANNVSDSIISFIVWSFENNLFNESNIKDIIEKGD